jgi:hypothetical protein
VSSRATSRMATIVGNDYAVIGISSRRMVS